MSVTKLVGEQSKFILEKLAQSVMADLGCTTSDYQQTSQHTIAGFVTSDRSAAHLHATNDLLSAIIGPRHIVLLIEDAVICPMFTQFTG